MHVADGFEVNLFAADPDFAKPIHMNWDAQGRLWIASSKNYPQLKPGAEPTDEIIVLEDTDGDGRADRRTVFADDLLIPTAVLPGDGGVYVANSTELIHLSDTDGDGQADLRRTVLSGFGTEDTHHLLHTLRWRPDGRMAMNQSIYIHSHLETPYGVKHLDGGGIWHFDPYTSQLDIFCKGFVNPWGHAINEFGQSLVTDGAYFEGINYTFPGAVFVTSPGATRWLSGLNPGSPKHCGLEFISGAAMPDDMHDVLVTNDFRGHRVCRFRIQRHGSGYRSEQLPELIRSEHIAFRPIDVKMGPDGAIYIADWYNPIIQHGEVDFRDPRRDTEHGRIWRITAKGRAPLQSPDYAAASESELVDLLQDSAQWVRQFARTELANRSAELVDQALEKLPDSAAPSAALQPLWMQLRQHRLQPSVLDQLRQHADPRVRAAAVRVIGERQASLDDAEAWLLSAVGDDDAQVVLEAVCGLHQLGSLAAVRGVLQAAERPAQDQYLKFAIWNALRATEQVWLPAFEQGSLVVEQASALEALADAATTPVVATILVRKINEQPADQQPRTVELIASQGDPQSLAELTRWILTSKRSPDDRGRLLQTVMTLSKSRNLVPAEAAQWLPELLQHVDMTADNASMLAATLAQAAEQWKVGAASPTLNRWLDQALATSDLGLMSAVLNSMASLGTGSDRQRISQLASAGEQSLAARSAAIAAQSSYDLNAASRNIIGLYGQLRSVQDPSVLTPAVQAVLGRKPGAAALTKAIAATTTAEWTGAQARELLAAVRGSAQADEQLIGTIVSATGLENAGWKMSPELTSRLIELAQSGGAAARGEQIYRREKLQCVKCHAIGPGGVAVGPNLVSLGGSSTPDYIVESLVDPAAKVKEGFQTLSVLLASDEIINGLQKAKTTDSLQLMLSDGTLRTISTSEIEAIREGKSLMPAGLVDELSERELGDLFAFLSALGRVPEYTVDTQNWVRNWMTLQWSDEANRRLNRTSLDTAATDDPALSWRSLTSLVNGRLPLQEAALFQPHREIPRMAFVRFDVDCKTAGKVVLRFTQPSESLSFWIDSKPAPTPTADQPLQLAAGVHRIVLGVRIDETDGTLGCEVVPAETDGAVIELPVPQ